MSKFKGTLIYTISNLSIKFGSVILLPILTRLLTPEEYGVIGYLAPITSIIGLCLGLGLYAPLMKKYSEYKSNLNIFGAYSFSFIVCITIMFITINVFLNYDFFKKIIVENLPLHISFGMIVISLWIAFFTAMNSLIISFYKIKNAYSLLGWLSIYSFICQYLLSVTLLTITSLGVVGYLLSSLITSCITFFFLFFKFTKFIKLSISISKIKYGLKNGLPMIFVELGDQIVEMSDRLILAKFVSMSTLGVYSLAITGSRIIQILGSSYTNTLISELYDTMNNKIERGCVTSKIESFYFILILLGVMGQLISYEIIELIFPNNYTNLTEYFIFLVPCAVIQYFYFLDFYFHYHEKSKIIPFFTLLTAFINVSVNLLFIQYYGVYAAIFSTFIAFFIRLIIQMLLINKLFSIKFKIKRLILYTVFIFIVPFVSLFIDTAGFFYIRFVLFAILGAFSITFIKVHFNETNENNNIHSNV